MGSGDKESPAGRPYLERSLTSEKEGGRASVASVNHEIDDAEEVIREEHEFTKEEYKKMVRKADLILMPVLMILYGLQYSDKVSLSQGVVFGLREETKLVGNQYADLTTYFYVAYAVAQLPMGYLMQRFPLGRALSTFVVCWGAMVMCLGACNNYAQLSGVRILLGWFESVVTPGFAVLTSSWYLRNEQTLRQGMYYSMNTLFAIIFGIGNYLLAKRAQERGGISAWRVINLFLGGLTVGMGIVCFFTIGTPNEVWWLSKREKRMAHARIVSNGTGGGEQHPWRWGQVKECFRDPAFYHAFLANILFCIPNGAITTFLTLLLKSFGFDAYESIIHQFPSFAISTVCIPLACTIVYFKPGTRFPLAIFTLCLPATFFLIVGLASSAPNMTRYIIFCFVTMFTTPMFLMWPLMSSNIAGRTKKTFNAGMQLLAYCVGNIIGSQMMPPSDAPRYLRGLTICAVVMYANCGNLGLWMWHYRRSNAARQREMVANGVSEELREHQNRLAGETDLTDIENRNFRYTC